MSHEDQYAERITEAWEQATAGQTLETESSRAVMAVMDLLDKGLIRVASVDGDGHWKTHVWVKKAVLLSFRIFTNQFSSSHHAYDKVPLKFSKWRHEDFIAANFRIVPGAIVRYSAYIAPKVVVMPSFINVGAYIDEGSMIDSYVTVGSAAQIGKNCHISMQAGIGGVLEPLQAEPTIIENGVFVGAGAQIAEGVRIGQGSVLAMNVNISASTKIYNRSTGEITYGRVPPYSVVVPGSLPDESGKYSTSAAVIVKQVDAGTRAKTQITELLRS